MIILGESGEYATFGTMLVSPCHQLRTRLPLVSSVLDTIAGLEGIPIIVGGAIRDWIMGLPCDDIDVEIFNIDSVEHLQFLLKPLGRLELVGRVFGVCRYRSPDGTVDFTMPRREHKIREGHTGFDIDLDPGLSFKEAALRRDFTMNAIGLDWLTNRVLDPYNGIADIRAQRIRHVGSQFPEDPLRVLRVVQFAARLNFTVDADTLALCRTIPLGALSSARILEEFTKLFSKSKSPSVGIALLEPLGVLAQWPELRHYHSSSELWGRGSAAVDQMARQLKPGRSVGLMVAAWLYHSQFIPSHAPVAMTFLNRIMESKRQKNGILNLISATKALVSVDKKMPDDSQLREASTVTQLRHVVALISALFPNNPQLVRYIHARSTELGILDRPPEPLVSGRDLMGLGIPEGVHLGEMLADFYSAQLAGKITSKATALRIAHDLWFGDQEDE